MTGPSRRRRQADPQIPPWDEKVEWSEAWLAGLALSLDAHALGRHIEPRHEDRDHGGYWTDVLGSLHPQPDPLPNRYLLFCLRCPASGCGKRLVSFGLDRDRPPSGSDHVWYRSHRYVKPDLKPVTQNAPDPGGNFAFDHRIDIPCPARGCRSHTELAVWRIVRELHQERYDRRDDPRDVVRL